MDRPSADGRRRGGGDRWRRGHRPWAGGEDGVCVRDTTSHHRRRLSGGGVRVEGARMRSRGPRARSRRGACPCVTCHRPSRRRRFGNFRRGDQACMAHLFDTPPPPRRRGSCPRPDSEQGPAALRLIASPRTEPLNSAAGNISPERGRGGGNRPHLIFAKMQNSQP